MAKLTRDDVLKLAKLSSLSLSEDEIKDFIIEIGEILGYVEKLQSVNLEEYQPTYQVTGLSNIEREDVAVDYGVSANELLKNLPSKKDNYIKVQRVLE